jgi:hypothetical protein
VCSTRCTLWPQGDTLGVRASVRACGKVASQLVTCRCASQSCSYNYYICVCARTRAREHLLGQTVVNHVRKDRTTIVNPDLVSVSIACQCFLDGPVHCGERATNNWIAIIVRNVAETILHD